MFPSKGINLFIRDCSSLEKIVLPEGLSEIRSSAFSGCKKLKELYIPEGVKELGKGSLAYCSSLKKLVHKDKILEIDNMQVVGEKNLIK